MNMQRYWRRYDYLYERDNGDENYSVGAKSVGAIGGEFSTPARC